MIKIILNCSKTCKAAPPELVEGRVRRTWKSGTEDFLPRFPTPSGAWFDRLIMSGEQRQIFLVMKEI
jgi:hypothetical protein